MTYFYLAQISTTAHSPVPRPRIKKDRMSLHTILSMMREIKRNRIIKKRSWSISQFQRQLQRTPNLRKGNRMRTSLKKKFRRSYQQCRSLWRVPYFNWMHQLHSSLRRVKTRLYIRHHHHHCLHQSRYLYTRMIQTWIHSVFQVCPHFLSLLYLKTLGMVHYLLVRDELNHSYRGFLLSYFYFNRSHCVLIYFIL